MSIKTGEIHTNVYNKVLTNLGTSVVAYGWSFGDQDLHILEAIKKNSLERVAVSVDTVQSKEDQQRYCRRVLEVLGTDVEFFDAQSEKCWSKCEKTTP